MATGYSLDDENFTWDFREILEILNDDGNLAEGVSYYSAEFEGVTPKDFIDVHEICDQMNLNFTDATNCEYDLEITREGMDALEKVLTEWAETYTCYGNAWAAPNVSDKKTITKTDVEGF